MSNDVIKTDVQLQKEKDDRTMNGVNIWASFYRANPNRFVKDYFGIILKKFQQIILCMMFWVVNNTYLASRGGGKSFLLAVFSCAYCILYPETKICIASKTRGQAAEIINKIQTELMPKSSNLRLEIAEVQVNQANSVVVFKNGSRIKVVTASESARHNRATILIVDEYRMVNKKTIDSVLRKFLTASRTPGFMNKPEYAGYPMERTKELYASSCWYKSHWSYEHVKGYVVNMIRDRSYFCSAMPYQLAIKEGLLDKRKVEDEMSEPDFSEIDFCMEMEGLFFGQSDGGLYNFDDLEKAQKILYPFLPKFENHKLTDKRLYIPAKQLGEKRILSADIALMSSSRNKNDATSIFINQMFPTTGDKYVNNIVYTTNNEGLRTDAQALIIRKLFEDYDCDHLAIDIKGLGLGVVDALLADIYDPETGHTYEALSCSNNEDIAKRCLIPNAPKKIWAITGSAEFNSQCALLLREAVKQGDVRLLVSEYDGDDALASIKGYKNLSLEDELNVRLPYIHTGLLINELVNLDTEVKNNVVRVKEKAGMRKDRYSSLSYNIYVSKMLERELKQERARDIKNQLVFEYRAPKINKRF